MGDEIISFLTTPIGMMMMIAVGLLVGCVLIPLVDRYIDH